MTRDPDVWTSHPSWFLVPSAVKDGAGSSGGTEQVRITAHKGAHQTDPPIIRSLRRSRFTDGVLIHVDLSQAELRTAALLSGEPSMVDEYAKELIGGKPDLHTSMTISIFGPHVIHEPTFGCGDTATDKRQWGKQANFAILFRASPDTFGNTIYMLTSRGGKPGTRLDPMICDKIVKAARRSRPVLWAWQETLLSEAQTYGHVTLPLVGSHRTFMNDPNDAGAKYEGSEIVNFPVQALAALTLLDWQGRINKRLWGRTDALLFLNVYDAMDIDATEDALPEVLKILEETFEETITEGLWGQLIEHTGNHVPLKYDTHVTRSPT